MPETIPSASIPMILVSLALLMTIIGTWIAVIVRIALGLRVLPPWTPRSVPWGGGAVVLSVLLWFGLQILVSKIYLDVTHRANLGPAELMTLSAASNALALMIVPLVLAGVSGARRQDFGFIGQGFAQQVFRGIVAYPLVFPFVVAAMLGATRIWKKTQHPLEEALKLGHDPATLVVLVLAGVVFAPMAEELIFRGVILGYLTRLILGRPKPTTTDDMLGEPELSTLGNDSGSNPNFADALDQDPTNPYAAPHSKIGTPSLLEVAPIWVGTMLLTYANIFVSVIFAGLHATVWPTPIPIFFLSLGLGVLYQRTGSLVAPMVLHMTFNGVSTLLMILSLGIPSPKDKEEVKPPPTPAKVEVKAAFEAGPNWPTPIFRRNLG